jgi:hypothetical protein
MPATKTSRKKAAPRKDLPGPTHKTAKPKEKKKLKEVQDPTVFTKRGLEKDLPEFFQPENDFHQRVRDGADEEDDAIHQEDAPPSLSKWYIRTDNEEEYETPPSESDDSDDEEACTLFHRTHRMLCMWQVHHMT